jgi:hypothetical protein
MSMEQVAEPCPEQAMSRFIQQQVERDLVAAFQSFVTQLAGLPNDSKDRDQAAVLAALGERLQSAVGKLELQDVEVQLLEHLRYTLSQVAAGVMLAGEVCYRMQRQQQHGHRPARPPAK